MRKSAVLSAAVSAVLLLSSACLPVSAAPEAEKKIPFTVEAPSKLSLFWLEEGDSPTTMRLAYSMGDSMCQWLSKRAEPTTNDETMQALEKDYQLSDLSVSVQIDWAIDDPAAGWHYNSYWDGETFTDDEGRQQMAGLGEDKDYRGRVSDWDVVDVGPDPQTVNDIWILRGGPIQIRPDWSEEEIKANNPWFYGTETAPGVKDELKEDQYTLVPTEDDYYDLHIDFSEHTAYVRARWAVTMTDMDLTTTRIFSDWSETASAGKDGDTFELLKPGDLPAPVISGLRYYPDEFNGYPQIACTLDVPEDISKKYTEISAHGGSMWVEWEARVPGGEWIKQQAGREVTAGENVVSLLFLGNKLAEEKKESGSVVLEKGSPVELRARYFCDQSSIEMGGEPVEEFVSDYSAVLTFGSEEMSKPEEASVESGKETSEEKTSSAASVTTQKTEEKKCSLCGFCPQPLGLCIFIWIAIAVAVVVVVVVVLVVLKKNSKKQENNAPKS